MSDLRSTKERESGEKGCFSGGGDGDSIARGHRGRVGSDY